MKASWKETYQQKMMSPEDVVNKFVKNGDTVYMGGLTVPSMILNPMFDKAMADELKGITLVGNLIINELPLADPRLKKENLCYKSFFFGGYERAGQKAGNVTFVPTQFQNFPVYMRNIVKPDISIISVTPPDENGYCNLGPFGSGFSSIAREVSKKMVVQVNKNIPRVCGLNLNIHVDDIDAFVEHEEPLTIYPMQETSEIDQKIANFIIDEIPDGACIQLGLGGMSNAVGYGLKDKKHLGVHTEMLTESMKYLIEIGAIDNSRKNLLPGKSVIGFTLGNQALYDFVNNNQDLYFASYEFTNKVSNIMQNDNVISINTALSIDLTGQVCSESLGFRHFSGVGGQVDYVRGALHSKGGKSFIAVSSTAKVKDKTVSKIVLDFDPGSATTTLRSDVQYIVTEYGCVNLFGEDIPTRAKKLISIAHPDFRDELTFEAKQKGYIY